MKILASEAFTRMARQVLALAALLLATVHISAADIEYVYDEAGRLVGVYAANGDAGQYVYDAAGNITAIKQFTTSQLAIIHFTPPSGSIGTTVSIHGIGFSATPSSNAVSFNGTAATVSAATTKKLTVTVPSGATTGTIAVTVGGNTATSTLSFTVTGSSGAPTITSFSPTGGTAGTSVTITGTNFSTVAASNVVTVNNTYASVSSASTTSLTIAVPIGTASGKIKVRTPAGTAVSATDFVIPFGSYSATDVETVVRATVDSGSAAFSTSTNGKIAYIVFDGLQGQNLGIGLSSLTTVAAGAYVAIHVRRPDNAELITSFSSNIATSVDLPPLPLTGTYTLAIVPGSSNRVSGTVLVSTDVTASIASAGTVSTLTSTRAGQNSTFSFQGTANQLAAFYISGISGSASPVKVDVTAPTGYSVASISSASGTSAYIQAVTLPLTGTYRVRVGPVDAGVGSWSVQYGMPDLVVTSVTLGSPTVNQNGSFAVPITAVITNQGTVGVKSSWYDYAYLSSDTTLDTTDRVLISQTRSADVASGGSYTLNLIGVTQTTTAPGTYNVMVKTDGYDNSSLYVPTPIGLIESNEGNNVAAAASVTFLDRPDLSVTIDSVGTVSINQNGSYVIPVTWTVTNNGPSAAQPSWYDECYISTDATLTTADPSLGWQQRTTALAPSASYTVTNKSCLTPTSIAAGTYTLFVKTDGNDSGGFYSATTALTETNETNNTATASVTIPARPDLIAAAPTLGTITGNADGSYNIPVTSLITNQGGSLAKASWYDECYLSADTSLTTADRTLGWVQRTTDLAAAGSYTFSKTCVVLSATTPGTYYLFVKADGNDGGGFYSASQALAEADETNNTAYTSFTLPAKADLTVGSLSVGTITVNGNGSYAIPITITVTNSGGVPAKASWADYCYLSTDSSLTTADDSLGFTTRASDVAVSGNYTVNMTCTTATTTTPGSYTVFFKTDGSSSGGKYAANSTLTEGDEGNNVASTSITLPSK